MRAIKFKQATINVAENQPQYQTLPAYYGQLGANENETGLVTCFELSDAEIESIKRHGKIWHSQLTFGRPMQPIQMFIVNDFFDDSKDKDLLRIPKDRKKIDFEKLPDVFRGLQFGSAPGTQDQLFFYKNGKYIGKISYSKNLDVWDFYLDNLPGDKKFYRTGLPYFTWEQFRLDCERIGIELTYISDEEDE